MDKNEYNPCFQWTIYNFRKNSTKIIEKRVQRMLKKIESKIATLEYKIPYPINPSPRNSRKWKYQNNRILYRGQKIIY